MKWLARYETEGRDAFRIGRDGAELVAEWPGVMTLRAQRDGSRHSYEPAPDADAHAIAKIRRGTGRALLRHLVGDLSLHGGAAAIEGTGIVLLGRSGQGKSTLTAALCAQAGAELYADDIVVVEHVDDRWWIGPAESEHWLDGPARRALGLPADGPDATEKSPVPATRFGDAMATLTLLVDLVFGDVRAPELTPLSELEAVAQLVPQVARFVLDEPEVHRRELDVLGRIVHRVPMVRLTRPREYDALPATIDLIVARAREAKPR
jgi:hypothetical protein